MGLEKVIKAAEERLREATERKAASREAAILESKQHAIDKLKQYEEYKAS